MQAVFELVWVLTLVNSNGSLHPTGSTLIVYEREWPGLSDAVSVGFIYTHPVYPASSAQQLDWGIMGGIGSIGGDMLTRSQLGNLQLRNGAYHATLVAKFEKVYVLEFIHTDGTLIETVYILESDISGFSVTIDRDIPINPFNPNAKFLHWRAQTGTPISTAFPTDDTFIINLSMILFTDTGEGGNLKLVAIYEKLYKVTYVYENLDLIGVEYLLAQQFGPSPHSDEYIITIAITNPDAPEANLEGWMLTDFTFIGDELFLSYFGALDSITLISKFEQVWSIHRYSEGIYRDTLHVAESMLEFTIPVMISDIPGRELLGYSLNGLFIPAVDGVVVLTKAHLDTVTRDVVLLASWSDTYEIYLLDTDGTLFSSVTLSASQLESSPYILTDLMNTGMMVFNGWHLAGERVKQITMSDFTSGTVVYIVAQWIRAFENYVVNLIDYDGKLLRSIRGITIAQLPLVIPLPTTSELWNNPEHTFKNWEMNGAAFSHITLADFGFSQTITLRAIWDPQPVANEKTYLIIQLDHDGRQVREVEVKERDLPFYLAPLTDNSSNRQFIGWFLAGDSNPVTGIQLSHFGTGTVVIVTADWMPRFTQLRINEFTIDGGLLHSRLIKVEDFPYTLTTPSDPERGAFLYWTLDGKTIQIVNTSDFSPELPIISVFAHFEKDISKDQVIVYFDTRTDYFDPNHQGGDEIYTGVVSKIFNLGGKATPLSPPPLKPGFEFTGWMDVTTTTMFNFNTTLTRSMQLIAVWEPVTSPPPPPDPDFWFSVFFDAAEGTLPADQPAIMAVPKWQILKMVTPSREGYTFKFWVYTDRVTGDVYRWNFENGVTEDMTLTAVWEINDTGPGPSWVSILPWIIGGVAIFALIMIIIGTVADQHRKRKLRRKALAQA
jgi:hypothetical protein